MDKNNTSRDVVDPLLLSVAASIEKSIEKVHPISSKCCIYRVTPKLRNLNQKVYTPQTLSIGPLHHGKQELEATEVDKLRFMQVFLGRTNLSLKQITDMVQNLEQEIRDCYLEKNDLTRDEFLKMVVVDSCFILEYIFENPLFKPKSYTPFRNLSCTTDLILLENQLPFFVLDRIYHHCFPNESDNKFIKLCIDRFSHVLFTAIPNEELFSKVEGHEIKHILDLLRLCQLPTEPRKPSDGAGGLVSIPNVTELVDAGIKLMAGSSPFPLDIEYTHGILKIPRIIVDEYSEYLISNILALEMCLYYDTCYVRNFMFFMDKLVDTPKDVDLLIQNRLLQSLSSDSSAVAKMFNYTGYDYPMQGSTYYLYDISDKLNAYCGVTRNRWKAAFKRDYCSTPWMAASTTAAIILLVLTLIQTICSIISLVKENH